MTAAMVCLTMRVTLVSLILIARASGFNIDPLSPTLLYPPAPQSTLFGHSVELLELEGKVWWENINKLTKR